MKKNLFVVCVLSLFLDIAFALPATAELGTSGDLPRQANEGTDGNSDSTIG